MATNIGNQANENVNFQAGFEINVSGNSAENMTRVMPVSPRVHSDGIFKGAVHEYDFPQSRYEKTSAGIKFNTERIRATPAAPMQMLIKDRTQISVLLILKNLIDQTQLIKTNIQLL